MAKLISVVEIVAGAPHHQQNLSPVIADVAETNYRAGSITTYAAMAEYLNMLMWETSAKMNDSNLASHMRLQAQWDLLSQLKCDCVDAIHRKE